MKNNFQRNLCIIFTFMNVFCALRGVVRYDSPIWLLNSLVAALCFIGALKEQ